MGQLFFFASHAGESCLWDWHGAVNSDGNRHGCGGRFDNEAVNLAAVDSGEQSISGCDISGRLDDFALGIEGE
jgi:hypothetical protein